METQKNWLSLSEASKGQAYLLEKIEEASLLLALTARGIAPGAPILVNSHLQGRVLLEINGMNMAMRKASLKKIWVSKNSD